MWFHLLRHVTPVSHRSLSMEDQISLLKGATFEIMQIRFNTVFNSATNHWKCGNITYCIHDAVRGKTTKRTLSCVQIIYIAWRVVQTQCFLLFILKVYDTCSQKTTGTWLPTKYAGCHDDFKTWWASCNPCYTCIWRKKFTWPLKLIALLLVLVV